MAAQRGFLRPSPILVWALRLLTPVDRRDAIVGDLLEEFRERASSNSASAQRWYSRQVWSFVTASPWFGCSALNVAGWFGAFAASCVAVLSEAVYAPGLSVAIFLVAAPTVSFRVAYLTENFRAGWMASIITLTLMTALATGLILGLGLRHPKDPQFLIPGLLCVSIAGIAALAGKCWAERLEVPRLTS